MGEILAELKDELQITSDMLKILAGFLFEALDTDKNGLIDGLELLSVLAVCSGMKKSEMIEFVLSLYDFDNSAELSFDELVLAQKSCCHGLCKVHRPPIADFREIITMPTDHQLEEIASQAFKNKNEISERSNNPSGKSKAGGKQSFDISLEKRNIQEITDELLRIPEVCSWLAYFCNFLEKREVPLFTNNDREEMALLSKSLLRSDAEKFVIDWKINGNRMQESADLQWKGLSSMLVPSAYASTNASSSFPNVQIKQDWVYGYQSERCRDNVHYTKLNDIVYTISKFAVVYSSHAHSQRVMSHHNEEIVCLTMHPSLIVAATGDEGPEPHLIVWNTQTLSVLYHGCGQHSNGILQIAFSPSGNLLLSVDNSEVKTIVATLWETDTIIYKDTLHCQYLLKCAVLNKNTLVCSCDSKIYFWNKYPEGYVRRAGVFPKNKSEECLLTLLSTPNGENLIAGTLSGKLMLWSGINCIRVVRGHAGAVNVLAASHEGFLSGGKDMRIRMWTYSLEPKFAFDVSKFGASPSVVGLAISADATSVLFSTKGADIFEISAIDGSDLRGGPIVKSHAFGCIHSMDVHPSKFEYATVGTDGSVRIVDMKTKTLLKLAQLDVEGRAIAYSPLGDVIAVGTDNKGNNGCMFVILNEETLTKTNAVRDSKHPVTTLKYSPEGDTLAVGVADGAIYLYSVHDDYDLVAKCARHNAAIISMDFSTEGEWLRSNSKDGELHFFNVDDGSYQSNISAMRDVSWAGQSCMYSWQSKGIYQLPDQIEKITCCGVPSLVDEKLLLVSGSSMGQVRAYSYPAVNEGLDNFRFHAHCHEVSDIKFSYDGLIMISVGKQDRSIIQWNILKNADPQESLSKGDNNENLSTIAFEMAQGERALEEYPPRPAEAPIGLLLVESTRNADASQLQWIRGILPPSKIPLVNNAVPDVGVHLHHVYGFETKTVRHNLFYTVKGEVIYTSGCYGLVWDSQTNSQRIYKFHTNPITAFACTVDGSLVATGDLGQEALVSIWESKTCTTVYILQERQAFSICGLAFSSSTEYLAVGSNDIFHTISVYNWRRNIIVTKFYAGMTKVLSISMLEDKVKDQLNLMVVGVQMITFWSNVQGKFPICSLPIYSEVGHRQTFVSSAIMQGIQPVVGTSDGNLYVFEGIVLKQMVKAHAGAVLTMSTTSTTNPSLLFSGGDDGVVRMWDERYECLKEFAMDSLSKCHFYAVRAIAVKHDKTMIVVGLQGAEVLEISLKDGTLHSQGSHIKGHSVQLYGMATHPKQDLFATTGDDAMLRVWDSKSRAVVKTLKLELGSRAVAYNPEGNILVIGFGCGRRVKGKLPVKEGAFLVINAESFKVLHEARDSQLAIRAVQFTADGKTLAIGSEDNMIYTYGVQDHYSHRLTIRTHQAPVVLLDFSVNNLFLMSTDAAGRVRFTMVSTGVEVVAVDEVKDEKWVRNSSPQTWSTQGVSLLQQGNDDDRVMPVVCERSSSGQLLATGTSIGEVLVSHFPAPDRPGIIRPGYHNSAIAAVHWLSRDSGFITIGAVDCMILQWKCMVREGPNTYKFDAKEDSTEEIRRYFQYDNDLKTTSSAFAPQRTIGEDDYQDENTLFPWTSMTTDPSSPATSAVLESTYYQQVKITRQFVHGRQRNARHPGVFYNTEGDVVYVAGNKGIIFDRNGLFQRYYLGHSAEIICLGISGSRSILASGDSQSNPEIHVWDALTAAPRRVLKGLHRALLLSLVFSHSNHFLLSIGQDQFHSVVVCHSPSGQWHDGVVHRSASITTAAIAWCIYSEVLDDQIIAGGEDGFLHFFRDINGSLVKTVQRVDAQQRVQALLCGTETIFRDSNTGVDQPCLLCGSSVGFIYAISADGQVLQRLSAHQGAIHAMTTLMQQSEQSVATVGADNCLKIWSSSLRVDRSINLTQLLPSTHGVNNVFPTMLSYSLERSSVLIGLSQGDLYEMSLLGQSTLLVTETHDAGEAHALAWNPVKEEYATAGDDGVLRVWHSSLQYCVRRKSLQYPIRAMAWSPDGNTIVVGIGRPGRDFVSSKDGAVIILNAATLHVLREEKKGKKYIADIVFHGDGEMIAVACGDGRVYLCSSSSLVTLQVVEVKTKRPAIRVDFSIDFKHIRVAYQPDRLLFYSLEQQAVVESPVDVRDVQWQSSSVPFSWQTQAAYQRPQEESVAGLIARGDQGNEKDSSSVVFTGVGSNIITSVAVNLKKKLFVCGYEDGEVALLPYPFTTDPHSEQRPVHLTRLASFASRMSFNNEGTVLVILEAGTRTVTQITLSDVL